MATIEGKNNPSWVLIDCDDVIVNIMLEDTRDFYDLESIRRTINNESLVNVFNFCGESVPSLKYLK